jgi:capsular polysaccharide biosynthesis protein
MEGNQEGIELMDYLEVLWKKKWLIVIPTLLLMIAAGVISFLITPVYEIDSIISPCKSIPKSNQMGFEEILLVSPKELAGKINQKVYLKGISEEMGIEMSDVPNVKAEVPDNSDLVRLTLRHKNTNLGKDVLEHLIAQIKKEMDERIDRDLKDIDVDIAWIKRQIEEMRMDIDAQHIEKKRLQEMISSKKNILMISKKREEAISKEMEEVKKKVRAYFPLQIPV